VRAGAGYWGGCPSHDSTLGLGRVKCTSNRATLGLGVVCPSPFLRIWVIEGWIWRFWRSRSSIERQ
jgi:hypothetical protein